MPKFFFAIKGNVTIEDYEGAELADGAAAMDEAKESARDLLTAGISVGQDRRAWSIQVRDERGHRVGVVRFEESVDWDHLAQKAGRNSPTTNGDP